MKGSIAVVFLPLISGAVLRQAVTAMQTRLEKRFTFQERPMKRSHTVMCALITDGARNIADKNQEYVKPRNRQAKETSLNKVYLAAKFKTQPSFSDNKSDGVLTHTEPSDYGTGEHMEEFNF